MREQHRGRSLRQFHGAKEIARGGRLSVGGGGNARILEADERERYAGDLHGHRFAAQDHDTERLELAKEAACRSETWAMLSPSASGGSWSIGTS